MSKEVVEKIIQRAATDSDFYRKLNGARAANEVLAHFELTAEERQAILNRDCAALNKIGVARELARLCDWCTGE